MKILTDPHNRDQICYSLLVIPDSIVALSLCVDGLAQDFSNSSALAMGLLESCAKPSIYVSYMYDPNDHPFWFKASF